MRTTRTFAATLAVTIAALAVPAAHAQQTDPAQENMHASVALAAAAERKQHGQRPDPAQVNMHASVALAAAAERQQQDARSADARDTATGPRADTASSQHPSTLVSGATPAAPAGSTDDGGTANGLGALAGLIVIGLAYLYTRRGRRAAL